MTAPLLSDSGAVCLPHPTVPDRWTVTYFGTERTITAENGKYVAEFCGELPQWTMKRAVAICVKDIEWHLFLHATALAEQASAEAHNAAIPRAERIAATELEIELLRFSDDPNSCARQDRLRAQLEVM